MIPDIHTQTNSQDLHTLPFILLTGASGYVGGRLLHALQDRGYPVRCLARRPEFLQDRLNASTQVVQGDVLDPPSLVRALQGIDVAYFLVHSMGSSADFAAQDRQAASNFAQAALQAGVQRIIYLGGLSAEEEELSPHLHSRLEVGRILRASGVPTIEFQASIIIGSGSLSFEMIRNLVERLPIMITPRWVRISAQPIFIDDVIAYLLAAIDLPISESRVYEIGGKDVVSYGGIMQEYARQRGLNRLMVPVPVLTPAISSLWLNLITPVYARIGRKLIDSIRHPTIVRNPQALNDFDIQPVDIQEAISRALQKEETYWNETRWSDSLSSVGPQHSYGGVRFGNRLIDHRRVTVQATPAQAFTPIRRIGGDTGWYYADWLWRIRGMLDFMFGGVGLRRGRRDKETLRVGESLDFWRVEAFEPDHVLRLFAEMKLPGRAWLEFEVRPLDESNGNPRVEILQTAIFDPLGLLGQLYWYGIYPLHLFVFAGMLRNIARSVPQSEE